MPLNNPTILPHAFAASALPANITNPVPDAPTGSNAASWTQGFPPITMTPKSSGGQPPQGQDMNGVLNAITLHTTFLQAGGVYKVDTTLLAVGYAKGTTLLLNDNVTQVTSLVDSNTTNPNTSMTGWQYLNAHTQPNFIAQAVGGVANAYTLSTYGTGAPATTATNQLITFTVPNAILNTGASTIAVNGAAAVPLTYADGSALQNGAVGGGNPYVAVAIGNPVSSYAIISLAVPSGGRRRVAYSNTFAVANPTGAMLGTGGTTNFTPTHSGQILVTMSCAIYDTVGEGVSIGLRYGTGSAPAQGAAPSGTAWGGVYQPSVPSGSAGVTFSANDLLSLTVGTSYWFDMVITNATGHVSVTNGVFTVVEE